MNFEFEVYYKNICETPIFTLVMTLVVLLCALTIVLYRAIKKKGTFKKDIVWIMIFLIINVSSFQNKIVELKSGGIYLLDETIEDAISKTGKIEDICAPSNRAFHFKGTNVNGAADITINGEIYLIEEVGNFGVGDTVTITYLPKSKVVLSIYHAEQEQ